MKEKEAMENRWSTGEAARMQEDSRRFGHGEKAYLVIDIAFTKLIELICEV